MGAKIQERRKGPPPAQIHLSDAEQERAQKHESLSAVAIHEAVRREGAQQLRRPSSSLAFSALAAGLSMGTSLIAEGLLHAYLPDADWRPLVSNLGYPLGFLIVVLGRQHLFTEDTLTVILPLLGQRDASTLVNVLRLWGVVLVANLVGALAIAWVLGNTPAFEPHIREAFAELGREALKGGFGTILLRGVFAGWLIALMVWLLPFAGTARVFVIFIITYVVGLAGFAHSIAGSIEVLYVVTTGEASWGAYFGGFMVPAVIGNILGGVVLVAVLSQAQVLFREPTRWGE